MNFSVQNRSQRKSFISSLSEDSLDSQSPDLLGDEFENNPKEIPLNDRSKREISSSKIFLFLGTILLFLLFLLSIIIGFILIQRKHQTSKYGNEDHFDDEDYLPLICSPLPSEVKEFLFVHNQLKCGLNRSSIFHIYCSNALYQIKSGENLTAKDLFDPPKIQLNYGFVSKISTKSFLLILIVRPSLGGSLNLVILQWIRYYSSSLDDEGDICSYKSIDSRLQRQSEHIFLLYATNSSKTTLQAKTICSLPVIDEFQLNKYIHYNQLILTASTNLCNSHPAKHLQ